MTNRITQYVQKITITQWVQVNNKYDYTISTKSHDYMTSTKSHNNVWGIDNGKSLADGVGRLKSGKSSLVFDSF